MKAEVEDARRRTHAAAPSETCTCTVCLIPRRLYEAWAAMDAARALVRHNGCLSGAVASLPGSTMPACDCTYCRLKAALQAFDGRGL